MSTTFIDFPRFNDSDSTNELQNKLILGIQSLEGHSYSLTAYINECQKRIEEMNRLVFQLRQQLIQLKQKRKSNNANRI